MIPVNIYLMLLIDEIYFYWFHRALHAVPYLWDKVHKIHHEIKSPTSITATYVSPIETNGVLAGSVLAGTIIRPDHFTFLVYIAFRTFTSVDSHSGWMLPFNPMSLVPFANPSFHHDLHHRFSSYQGNAKNLSGVLALDSLFGTHSEFKPKNAVARDSLKVE
ncbi:fatty acid hydroxylase superfamily-domain-containing protein [Zopfochytrium polystomum]|nr:fatty acid hydroxylase superfamily-domain-containing protein [Zopfochytrium polystomum]